MKYSRAKHVVTVHAQLAARRVVLEKDLAKAVACRKLSEAACGDQASYIRTLEICMASVQAEHLALQAKHDEIAGKLVAARANMPVKPSDHEVQRFTKVLDENAKEMGKLDLELTEAQAVIAEIELREVERQDREKILFGQLKNARNEKLQSIDNDAHRAMIMRKMSDDRLQRIARQRSKDESSVKPVVQIVDGV